MPLPEPVIDEAVRRYRRESDCYAKLARFVAEKCESDIVRASAIRASVTHRAKSADKVREKLVRKYKDKANLNTVEDALNAVTDLAGVRVSTYQEQDRDKVVEAIKRLFTLPVQDGGQNPNRKDNDEKGKFYRATHCQVVLLADDLEEPYENLEGLSCEIQVCSMLAHVWNEIEHDLAYKPTTGNLSPREKESLDVLGNLTLSGDVVIKQLFDANAERLAKRAGEGVVFQDRHDFIARIRDHFPASTDFGSYAGQLFDDLMALGLNSPAAIKQSLLSESYQELSATLLAALQQYLVNHHDDVVELQASSSDPLLMLLLNDRLDQVLARHPMGRGRGRPPRIASVAARFRDMREQHNAANQPPPPAGDGGGPQPGQEQIAQ
jgi:ppGpp synthetase/RelA/SpoT-type nucleotidyltranferase